MVLSLLPEQNYKYGVFVDIHLFYSIFMQKALQRWKWMTSQYAIAVKESKHLYSRWLQAIGFKCLFTHLRYLCLKENVPPSLLPNKWLLVISLSRCWNWNWIPAYSVNLTKNRINRNKERLMSNCGLQEADNVDETNNEQIFSYSFGENLEITFLKLIK